MTEREKKELQSQIQILEKNVRDLEEQLHNAYKRINELQSQKRSDNSGNDIHVIEDVVDYSDTTGWYFAFNLWGHGKRIKYSIIKIHLSLQWIQI